MRASELVAAEFVDHAAQAGNCQGLSLVRERAFGLQTGKGIVMRALAGPLALPADAGGAVDHRRILRRQTQVVCMPFPLRVEHMKVTCGLFSAIGYANAPTYRVSPVR